MATLNLNGTNITLPDGTVFTTSYLTGSNNVTNNNAGKSGNATLTEGGGGAGNTYSGTISTERPAPPQSPKPAALSSLPAPTPIRAGLTSKAEPSPSRTTARSAPAR